ncbi:DUF922 domain-containing protein [Hymenobacter sp. BT770]|uniref:DUF922 domain-containing protein n=1 Tax=Hymenobacter sp. BT770 TaxID=2886942 RepID=UPI001D0FBE1D|nr:DUF922 domain-containing protein [Hymenobacter sp. BT770]MCC3152347.1 DUF922 domain-containing Zn-dependent protease [Hymenobacter sp. BT770]MDO3414160.1 DUF922 domain-containing protein [Hymenobacter sp. BT770]
MLSFLTSLLAAATLFQGPAAKPAQAAPAAAKPAAAPIAWSANRPLTVADFLSRPKPYERLAALTTTDIKAGAACRDFVFTGTVQATFDPNTSWFRDPKNFTPALLRHEQMHFDLTEVYARIMRQKLVVFQAKVDCNKLQPAFNNLTKSVYAEWDREQNRYDAETNHGLNAAKQAYWEKQTQTKLAQLEAFAAHE